jgi:DNA-cytosine methyltransferase
MKAISLFSGVGGMDLGLHRAGFKHVAFCEADPYRREVLRRHWPGVPVHDDVRTFEYDGQVDLLAGGFPCQDLSVAGKRKGLAGERSGLFYDAMRIADRVVRPGGFLVLENVAGLLSSNDGRDMAIVLRSISDLGFSVGYRTVDSQFFRVPQRRRRVFIVGVRAESDVPVEVLALLEGSSGDSQEGGEAWQGDTGEAGRGVARVGEDVTQSLTRRFGNSGPDLPDAEAGWLVPEHTPPLSPTVTAKWRKGGGPAGDECQNLLAVSKPPATTTPERTGST